jgi:hypothetical protein
VLKEFLDEPTRKSIEDLRALLANDKILISINSSRLLVRKHSIIGGLNELNLFGDLANQLYDRILHFWQKASGIEIIDDRPEDPTRCPVCQVCGVEITEDVRVYCRRCRTPHHVDCWSFNDGCSTYACGEKKFTKKY